MKQPFESDNDNIELNSELKQCHKKIKFLERKLKRSNFNRRATEAIKDKTQRLMKTINAEIEYSRKLIEAKNAELETLNKEIEKEKKKSDALLENILPCDIAEELKQTGKVKPVNFESVSVLFTDFKGFTQIAEKLSPEELIHELDYCFSFFDKFAAIHGMEKLKTIGDSYMSVCGVPIPDENHAVNAVKAALDIVEFMDNRKQEKISKNEPYWQIRVGINSGPAIAGIIGEKKFTYDIWGDTVNLASRMESSGEPGKVNISASTYELVKNHFECQHRGKIIAKNKGQIDMYFVKCLKES